MTTILVTGASRGIGLEHVRQALTAGETVIAACRTPIPGDELDQLRAAHPDGRLRIEQLDVVDQASVEALAVRLEGVAIDVLINNAGIYGPRGAGWPDGAVLQTVSGMNYDVLEAVFRTNVFGPLRMTAALRENVAASAHRLVVMMSSDLGSIANNTQGQSHAYRPSKAALNMLTRGLAVDLRSDGINVVSMAPGWVRTELGGEGAIWTAAESVSRQRAVIATLGPAHSGRFINLNGEEVAW